MKIEVVGSADMPISIGDWPNAAAAVRRPRTGIDDQEDHMSVKKYVAILFSLVMLAFASAFVSAQSNGCNLTVKTTSNGGTVWGTILVSFNGQTVTVSQPRQTLSVPCGSRVTLTEKPTNPSSWQFSSWESSGATFNHPSTQSVHFTLNGPLTVSALYSEQSASSTSSSSSSSWG